MSTATAQLAEQIIRNDMRHGRRVSGLDAHSELVRASVRYLSLHSPAAWEQIEIDWSERRLRSLADL